MTDQTVADLDDIETVEPEDETTEATTEGKAKKEKTPSKPKIEFGAAQLAAHVSQVTETTVDSKAVRMVLRRLTSEGKLEHEQGGRYEFTGPEDPRVVVVVDAFRVKIAKAAEPKAPRKARATKGDAAPAAVVEDEDAPVEDLDDLDA